MAIIDGKLVSATVREEIKEKIAEAGEKYGKTFKLTVIIAGNDPASEIYVRNKGKACEAVGIQSETISRHSVTYFNMDGDNSSMGYPKSLLGFLNPYIKARF